MPLTGQDLLKARNVRVAAGYDDSVGLTLHVIDGPIWFAAYGKAKGVPTPVVNTVSPVGQGSTDIAALNSLFAAMVSSTAATATAEAAQSTAAANIASAVAAAAA